MNHIYKPIYNKHINRIRYLKTALLKSFETEAMVYSVKNRQEVKKASFIARTWLTDHPYIQLDTFFVVPFSKIMTQKNKVKRCDVMNHLKALYDGLAAMLEIDDRYFTTGRAEYVLNDSNQELNYCIIRFRPKEIAKLSDIVEELSAND